MTLERVEPQSTGGRANDRLDVRLELRFGDTNEPEAELASSWRDRTSVLVFLRHFG